MQENTTITNQTAQIALAGELTFSDHDSFRQLIKSVAAAKCKTCVFDLSKLEAIDSAGIGMLLLAVDEGTKHGFKISVKSPVGQVKRLFELTKLHDVIPIAA